MATADVQYVTYALVDTKGADRNYYAPTAYDKMIKKLLAIDWSKNSKYECQLVNTDRSTRPGKHWILFLWACHNGCLKVHIWELYPHTELSSPIYKATKLALTNKLSQLTRKTKKSTSKKPKSSHAPTFKLKIRAMGLQKATDNFGCGYIGTWVLLILNPYFENGGSIDEWSDTHIVDDPPKSWFTLVYQLLEVRDMQPDGKGASDLNLRPLWLEMLSKGQLRTSAMISRIKKYRNSIQVM
jgi:hypothetical protein